MRIGVLALQGAFAEHIAVLDRLQVEAKPVRLPKDLVGLDGLIIPGGESTTMSRLMLDFNLTEAIRRQAENHLAIMGTCAGMVMLATRVSDSEKVESLKLMDISVRRNAFGRQVDSFEANIPVPVLGDKPFHAVFIRAPLVESIDSAKVEILARLDDGTIIAARQGRCLATAFHPELTEDTRFHQYFLDIITRKDK